MTQHTLHTPPSETDFYAQYTALYDAGLYVVLDSRTAAVRFVAAPPHQDPEVFTLALLHMADNGFGAEMILIQDVGSHDPAFAPGVRTPEGFYAWNAAQEHLSPEVRAEETSPDAPAAWREGLHAFHTLMFQAAQQQAVDPALLIQLQERMNQAAAFEFNRYTLFQTHGEDLQFRRFRALKRG